MINLDDDEAVIIASPGVAFSKPPAGRVFPTFEELLKSCRGDVIELYVTMLVAGLLSIGTDEARDILEDFHAAPTLARLPLLAAYLDLNLFRLPEVIRLLDTLRVVASDPKRLAELNSAKLRLSHGERAAVARGVEVGFVDVDDLPARRARSNRDREEALDELFSQQCSVPDHYRLRGKRYWKPKSGEFLDLAGVNADVKKRLHSKKWAPNGPEFWKAIKNKGLSQRGQRLANRSQPKPKK